VAQYFELAEPIVVAWIWNVSGAVSPFQYSRRPDVMLVQHAINCLMGHCDLLDDHGQRITSYLARDGYMGPKTNAAIGAFQRYMRSQGCLVKVDGVVNPSSRSGWTEDGHAQYTIVYLNREYQKLNGTMMREEDFPELLRADLQANRNLR
jgi:hypothetical protein